MEINAEKLKSVVDRLEKSLEEIKGMISGEIKPLTTPQQIKPQINQVDGSEFDQLLTLLKSDKWPEASDPIHLCEIDSEEDQTDRGEMIIDLNFEDEEIAGKRILDFGCGAGYTIKYLGERTDRAEIAVGYDVVKNGINTSLKWDAWDKINEGFKEKNIEGCILTTNWEDVVNNGPYDAVLLYDVFDHIENDTIEGVLEKIKSVMKPKSFVIVRCHPFISKHATHLVQYHKENPLCNKAFVQCIFTPEELEKIYPGMNYRHKIKITRPYASYQNLFKKSGFDALNEQGKPGPVKETFTQVDSFFETPIIANRIQKVCSFKDELPKFQMSICFLEYRLTLAST